MSAFPTKKSSDPSCGIKSSTVVTVPLIGGICERVSATVCHRLILECRSLALTVLTRPSSFAGFIWGSRKPDVGLTPRPFSSQEGRARSYT